MRGRVPGQVSFLLSGRYDATGLVRNFRCRIIVDPRLRDWNSLVIATSFLGHVTAAGNGILLELIRILPDMGWKRHGEKDRH